MTVIVMGFRTMRTSTTICLVLPLVALLAWSAPAGAEAEGDMFEVEFEPVTVELSPGGEAEVTLTVTNRGEETVAVAFEFIPVDAPRRSEGYFTTVYTHLSPASSLETKLVVRSNARRTDDTDISDFVVRVSWGRDLLVDDEQRPLPSTVEGVWEHEFKVVYDKSPSLGLLPVVLVIIVSIAIAALLLYPGWSKGTGDMRRGRPPDR